MGGRLKVGNSWKAWRLHVWEAGHRQQKLDFTVCLSCGYKTMNGSESIRVANVVWSGRPNFLPQGIEIYSGVGKVLSGVVSECLRGAVQLGKTELLSVACRKISVLVLGSLPVTDATITFQAHFFRGNVCRITGRGFGVIRTYEHWLWL